MRWSRGWYMIQGRRDCYMIQGSWSCWQDTSYRLFYFIPSPSPSCFFSPPSVCRAETGELLVQTHCRWSTVLLLYKEMVVRGLVLYRCIHFSPKARAIVSFQKYLQHRKFNQKHLASWPQVSALYVTSPLSGDRHAQSHDVGLTAAPASFVRINYLFCQPS